MTRIYRIERLHWLYWQGILSLLWIVRCEISSALNSWTSSWHIAMVQLEIPGAEYQNIHNSIRSTICELQYQ